MMAHEVRAPGDASDERPAASTHDVVVRMLEVPPLACVVPPGVFDAWSWCESDVLEWRSPARELAIGSGIDGTNPPGLVFVMREDSPLVPRELARLHAFGYGLEDELALAPYAIDDATDRLYEARVRPRELFWLAASTLEALVWGLHDWVHFHNHGPFDQPAMTELQCDLVALAWLRGNAERIGVDAEAIERVARDLATLSRRRFAEEGKRPPTDDLDALFLGPYPTRRVDRPRERRGLYGDPPRA